MKEALYWTIRRQYGSYEVIRVTSERGNNYRKHVYGSIDGIATHANYRDTFGAFQSETEANDHIAIVRDIQKKYKELRKPLEIKISSLHSQEDTEIKAALS